MTTLTLTKEKYAESHTHHLPFTRIMVLITVMSYGLILCLTLGGIKSQCIENELHSIDWKPSTIIYEAFGNENIYFTKAIARDQRPQAISSTLFQSITHLNLKDLTSWISSEYPVISLIQDSGGGEEVYQSESPELVANLPNLLDQYFNSINRTTSAQASANPASFKAVEKFQPLLNKDLKKYDLQSYTPVLMALMQQESKGKGGDPMQASESAGLKPNTIKDPKQSVAQGVKYFSRILKYGEEKHVDFQTIIQSYNMGVGYINFIAKHGKKHTEALAKQFSMEQVKKNPKLYNCGGDKNNFRYPYCYGDFTYVSKVSNNLIGIMHTMPVITPSPSENQAF
ncbi:hypothetical protein JOD43_001232 [Pullulanibacillus pueri]|uniref:CwlT-like lysozyme domain-containing protein n=1 Tax=Pullulanibacillus pueri TaxID=1437324 RepID=A0A8J2ZTT1_9BACL|nr:hypothetical protein [Pullulanibacillus pueri]GGH76909.1 hypothetical protein GCM10007096_08020 [Pullulanibacillus pueri]